MAIYRAQGNRNLLLLGLGGLVVGLVIGGLVGRFTAPSLADQVAGLRAQSAPIFSSLEVIRTEYPKLLAASGDPGGAEAALARVQSTFAGVQPSLAIVDPPATAATATAIGALAALIAARAPEADVLAAADAVEQAVPRAIAAPS